MADDGGEPDRRSELRDLNTRAWEGESVFIVSGKLDSSMKKNMSFNKKIKASLNADQAPHILKDIRLLSILKYLTELIPSLYEGLVTVTKLDDIAATVEIISALHQRFQTQFTPDLIVHLLIGLSNEYNQDEDTAKLQRQKALLTFVTELTIVGVIRDITDVDKLALPDKIVKKFSGTEKFTLIVVLKDLLRYEIKEGFYLGIIAPWYKKYWHLIESSLPEQAEKFNKIFQIYIKFNVENLVALNTALNQEIKSYNKSNIKYGQTFEDRSLSLEASRKRYDTIHLQIKVLCEAMDYEFPELSVLKVESEDFSTLKTIEIVNDGAETGIWDSPQEEKFYTSIPSLESLNPKNLELHISAYKNKTDGEKITQFLSHFNLIDNEETVELLVVEFNKLELTNKATMNRLFQYFTESLDSSSYRFYTKFLKINYDNLKELSDDIIEFLDVRLRSQVFNDKLSFRYIYFYVELIKFKLIPNFKIFHKLNLLVENIKTSNNLDILTVIFDKAGKILLYDSYYREKMLTVVSMLNESKKSALIPLNTKSAIKNLLLTLEAPSINRKKLSNGPQLTPKQAFLVRIMKSEIGQVKNSVILKILKKFDFSNPEFSTLIIDLFTKIEYVKFDKARLTASLLRELTATKGDQTIAIKVIDELTESILRGIELNDYRMNKERVLHIKLIAELFNVNAIVLNFVIDLAFKMVCYGNPNNQPLPFNYEAELDLPDNFFKIQLVCALFNSMDHILYLTSKSDTKKVYEQVQAINKKAKQKLQSFICFFQYYIFCKEPLPIEIEFDVNKMLSKFDTVIPVQRFDNLNDTLMELKRILQEKLQRSKKAALDTNNTRSMDLELEEKDIEDEEEELVALGDDEVNSDSDSDSESDVDSNSDNENEDQEDSGSGDSDAESIQSDMSDTAEDFTETDMDDHPKVSVANKFDQELEKEFNRLTVESQNTVSAKKNTNAHITIPKSDRPEKFSLLVKNGKRSDLKEIMYMDDSLKQRIMKEKEKRELNNKRVIDLVMNMDN